MKKLIIISIAILTIFSCCKKEDPKPNFGFSCKINGRFWTPRYQHWCPSCHAFQSSYYPNGARIYAPGTFDIKAILDTDERREYIYIIIKYLHEGDNLKKISNRYLFYNWDLPSEKGEECRKYKIDTSFKNRFFIEKLDTINQMVKGNFDLRVVSTECNDPDTIYMTEGKFDISPLWFK